MASVLPTAPGGGGAGTISPAPRRWSGAGNRHLVSHVDPGVSLEPIPLRENGLAEILFPGKGVGKTDALALI